LQLVIGNLAGLWKAIHTPSNFHVDVTVVDKVMQFVVIHDCWGNNSDRDAHVGIVGGLHGCAKVEILEVTHHAPRAGGGDNTVEEEFGSDDVGSFGADIAQVFNLVTTNGPPDMMRHRFFRSMGAYNAEISGTLSWGNGSHRDEEHSVSPGNSIGTLGKSVDFGCIGMLPEAAIGAVAKFLLFGKLASIGIKGVAVQSSMGYGVKQWVLAGMQSREPFGLSWASLAMRPWWCGSCHSDHRWWLVA